MLHKAKHAAAAMLSCLHSRRYDPPKGVEVAAPSRSSMSSLRSDMACVAEFLDNGPGMDGLNTRHIPNCRQHVVLC